MAFVDEFGNPLVNNEGKIRITLSEKARQIIEEDMFEFGVAQPATFINTVFFNYKLEAMASISLNLQQRKAELENLFSSEMRNPDMAKIMDLLINDEKNKLNEIVQGTLSQKGESKLYNINKENIDYLSTECSEENNYKSPGQYIRAVVEEYCSLPFINRERIFRKEIFDTIETACEEHRLLKIKLRKDDSLVTYSVYPYKILPDQLHSRSYLACYSGKSEDKDQKKIIASFSMVKVESVKMFKQTFHLSKEQVSDIETRLKENPVAYLLNSPEQIKVRLTEKGKKNYHAWLTSRPQKINSLSSDEVYVFECSPYQAYSYFFKFGPEVEIISPNSLRNMFKNNYKKALNLYTS